MIPRREVRRMEKALAALPDPGCPACRDRRGLTVLVEDGVWPDPCPACGKLAEFVIEFADAPHGGEVGEEEQP